VTRARYLTGDAAAVASLRKDPDKPIPIQVLVKSVPWRTYLGERAREEPTG
jgi:hypothetical protein